MAYLLLLAVVVLLAVARADIYLHNPRGSNDRGCETNDNRNNGNRLFDSQNNAKGGYACGNAYPFACYLLEEEADRRTCNELNSQGTDDISALNLMDNGGLIVANNPKVNGIEAATRTDRMFFLEGSELLVEWTNQHGCGSNSRTSHCDVIIQYACEDTLSDECGEPGSGKRCGPRDGLPITNSDNVQGNAQYVNVLQNQGNININRKNRDRDATETIPTSLSFNAQSDPRFGRHEGLEYFVDCAKRERNKGLFTADQNINGNRAVNTRQNPNGNRNGLECPEESEYFPYWHPSPWKDIAILTDQVENCASLQAESQNVKAKDICVCPGCPANQPVPNQEVSCIQKGGQWQQVAPFNIPAPFCGKAPTTRENHLGAEVGQGSSSASGFNWTIPTGQAALGGNTCVLRVRYNISTGDDISPLQDQRDVTVFGTNAQNGVLSPIKDRQNSEELSYVSFLESNNAKVGLEINTNQFGRTFQDRSLSFSIKPRPTSGPCSDATKTRIFNLNVRGKRGNIVQVYPAVEYDFVPSELSITEVDCVHVQWTGSDYNPARNDNDAFGGPNDPQNMNNGRADRSNLVELAPLSGNNLPVKSLEQEMTVFKASLQEKLRLVFLDQAIADPSQCADITEIRRLSTLAKAGDPNFQDRGNNFLDQDEDKDRFFKNCAKLSGQRTPYFNGGLLQAGTLGTHTFFSSRNTCFSNRDQRAVLNVLQEGAIPFPGQQNLEVDPVPIVAGIGGALFALGAFAGLVVVRRRRQGTNSSVGGGDRYMAGSVQQGFNNFRSSFANFGGGFAARAGSFTRFGQGGGLGSQPQQVVSYPQQQQQGGGFGMFAQQVRQSLQTPWNSKPSSPVPQMPSFTPPAFISAAGPAMGQQQQDMPPFPGRTPTMGSQASLNGQMPPFPGRTPTMGSQASSNGQMPPFPGRTPTMGSQTGGQQRMMTSFGSQGYPGSAHVVQSGSTRAVAMYDHVASESGELNFRKGDTVTVLRRDASGWWEGECNGQRGIFPANYVRVQSNGWN